jgi:hypothetical protein
MNVLPLIISAQLINAASIDFFMFPIAMGKRKKKLGARGQTQNTFEALDFLRVNLNRNFYYQL